jgi:glycosyltransferase involved in cell wall biosynthesis
MMSDEFEEMYKKAGGKDAAKFTVITNGFDEGDISKEAVAKDKKFSIAHIGTLVKDRNPTVLWKVLRELVNEDSEFEKQLDIKLVGKIDIHVKEQLESFGLTKYVNKIEYLSHDKVIVEQQKSRVLLLLVNNTKNARGILTGKFFEYMAANSPVLAIGPTDGDLSKIMNETGVGLISGFDDATSLKKNIIGLFNGTNVTRNETAIGQYSRRNLTKSLGEMLNKLTLPQN